MHRGAIGSGRDIIRIVMPNHVIHCVTDDAALVREIDAAAAEWELPLSVSRHDDANSALAEEAPSASDVVVIDADFAGERFAELLERCRDARTVVVGSSGWETALSHAHALHGSEFLLKDAEARFALLVPTLIRKLLREEDRDETTRDMIRSSEERYRSLIEALPDIVYKIDPNGYFTYVNSSVRILGYEPSELIGHHFSTIVEEQDLGRISRRKVLREYQGRETGAHDAPALFDERRTGPRRTSGLEIRLKTRSRPENGTDRHLIASLTSYGEITATGHYRTDTSHRYFTGTVGIIRNITERKQSQKRLRQLSFAVEQISTALCIADGEGTVDYANPSFFRLNDVRPEEAFGTRLVDVFAGYLQEEREGEFADALRGTVYWQGDRIVWTRSGDSRWCWFRVHPVFDLDQRVSQYVLFQEDVTERKQRELELAKSAAAHQDVLRVIHHRVGASLRALRSPDSDAADLDRRLRAQALAHELMHHGATFDRLDVIRYLQEAEDLVLSRISARGRLAIEVPELILRINEALPLALSVVECLAELWPTPQTHTRVFKVALEHEDDAKAMVIRYEGADPFARVGESLPSAGAPETGGDMGTEAASGTGGDVGTEEAAGVGGTDGANGAGGARRTGAGTGTEAPTGAGTGTEAPTGAGTHGGARAADGSQAGEGNRASVGTATAAARESAAASRMSVIETLLSQVDGTLRHADGEIRLSFRADIPTDGS